MTVLPHSGQRSWFESLYPHRVHLPSDRRIRCRRFLRRTAKKKSVKNIPISTPHTIVNHGAIPIDAFLENMRNTIAATQLVPTVLTKYLSPIPLPHTARSIRYSSEGSSTPQSSALLSRNTYSRRLFPKVRNQLNKDITMKETICSYCGPVFSESRQSNSNTPPRLGLLLE